MADQIVITEKTSQAKDVRAAVGSRYGDILPAEGHLLDLLEPEDVVPAWKRWSPILLRPEGLYGTRPAGGGNKAAKLKAIREALRTTGPGRRFTIPVYDGARRFDIVGEILPRNGPADGTLRAGLTLRPIAGFRGETSEDGDPDDAPRKVELTVTDDARLLPLSITVPVFFMPLVIRFEELCPTARSCSK